MAGQKSKSKHNSPPTSRYRIAAAALVLLVLAAMSVMGITAKYVQSGGTSFLAKVASFYFTSDYLSESRSDYTLHEGSESFTFRLRNYDGLNVSDLNINWEVTVVPNDDTDDITVQVQPAGSDETLNNTTGTLKKAKDSNGNLLTSDDTVTVSGLDAGKTYTISATGSRGLFSKTLTATVTVAVPDTQIYKNTKVTADYALLTVWSAKQNGTIDITVPTGLIPDGTDPLLTGKDAGSKISYTLNSYNSRSFRFFRTTDYDGSDIPVTHNNIPLEETELH